MQEQRQGFVLPGWVLTVLRGVTLGLLLGTLLGVFTGLSLLFLVMIVVFIIKILEWPWQKTAWTLAGILIGVVVILLAGDSFRKSSVEDLIILSVTILLAWGS